ncbi:hypothetical protein B0H10DRAFT_1954955 [Mycena sp. CBHHK59/15]|nr:hypothetical protein B0H10DRAFT_1954955 [Mycena sp. CBHHK59/15]
MNRTELALSTLLLHSEAVPLLTTVHVLLFSLHTHLFVLVVLCTSPRICMLPRLERHIPNSRPHRTQPRRCLRNGAELRDGLCRHPLDCTWPHLLARYPVCLTPTPTPPVHCAPTVPVCSEQQLPHPSFASGYSQTHPDSDQVQDAREAEQQEEVDEDDEEEQTHILAGIGERVDSRAVIDADVDTNVEVEVDTDTDSASDSDNGGMLGLIKITSADPRAMAQAVAILKHHDYDCFMKLRLQHEREEAAFTRGRATEREKRGRKGQHAGRQSVSSVTMVQLLAEAEHEVGAASPPKKDAGMSLSTPLRTGNVYTTPVQASTHSHSHFNFNSASAPFTPAPPLHVGRLATAACEPRAASHWLPILIPLSHTDCNIVLQSHHPHPLPKIKFALAHLGRIDGFGLPHAPTPQHASMSNCVQRRPSPACESCCPHTALIVTSHLIRPTPDLQQIGLHLCKTEGACSIRAPTTASAPSCNRASACREVEAESHSDRTRDYPNIGEVSRNYFGNPQNFEHFVRTLDTTYKGIITGPAQTLSLCCTCMYHTSVCKPHVGYTGCGNDSVDAQEGGRHVEFELRRALVGDERVVNQEHVLLLFAAVHTPGAGFLVAQLCTMLLVDMLHAKMEACHVHRNVKLKNMFDNEVGVPDPRLWDGGALDEEGQLTPRWIGFHDYECATGLMAMYNSGLPPIIISVPLPLTFPMARKPQSSSATFGLTGTKELLLMSVN